MIERTDEGGYCEACAVHSFPLYQVTYGCENRTWVCDRCAYLETDLPPVESDDVE